MSELQTGQSGVGKLQHNRADTDRILDYNSLKSGVLRGRSRRFNIQQAPLSVGGLSVASRDDVM